MNLPDITLLFQILHFIIAYVILRKFVFGPALILLEQGESDKNNLQQKVDNNRVALQELAGQQRQRWKMIQQSLMNMIPGLSGKQGQKASGAFQPVDIVDVQIPEQSKKNIRDLLTKELSDVKL